MENTHYYEVSVNWNEGRTGTMDSPALNKEITVATPPEFAKGVPGIWSPEHLFTAAINSCLMTTFLAIAENFKLEFTGFSSRATGKLEIVDGKYMMSEVTLEPILTIPHQGMEEKAMRVLQKAEAACLISNSVRSSIIFHPQVLVQQAANA
ncbi:MAG: OsmC family protein [Flavipsychrobacter sp.]|nr:OsmC family protein [Flavipsychrobacter sp.]